MKIITNDTVLVIAGKHKGKIGKVARAFPDSNKVIVEGVNIITRHIKKTAGKAGERVQYEKPIDASNVKLISPTSGKPVRVGYQALKDGKKVRIEKKTGQAIPNPKLSSKS